MDERLIENELRGLAPHVRFPPTPDLASATRRRLDEIVDLPGRTTIAWRPRLAVAAIALLLVAGLLASSSTVRDVIAGWFDMPGIRLRSDGDRVPAGPQAGIRDWLGEALPLDEIARVSPFPVSIPAAGGLGPPDESYVVREPDVAVVSVIYLAGDALPPLAGTDAGLLMIQFPATPESVWLEKLYGREANLEVVRVNGIEALWIEGTHRLTLANESTPATERETANVLIWHADGITYRLEAALSQERMIEIAESLRPIDD